MLRNRALSRIVVDGLQGNKTLDVSFKSDALIIVGENGSGKTTFLRILFNLLSGRWLNLFQIKFNFIAVWISGKEYKINHDILTKTLERHEGGIHLPPSLRRQLMDVIANPDQRDVGLEIQRLSVRYGIHPDLALRQLELFDEGPGAPKRYLREMIQAIRTAIDAQILYLPTYRRIERELGSIFEGIDVNDLKKDRLISKRNETSDAYIELVEFGMKDVQTAIETSLSAVGKFAREKLTSLTFQNLGDIVDRKYHEITMNDIANVSGETIRAVLDRVPESILTALHKQRLVSVIEEARRTQGFEEHTKIVFNYVTNLLQFQKLLEEIERPITNFCSVCSRYMQGKRFLYDRTQFGFSIALANGESNSEQKIELSDLSSGEKQIVSLFSHLYLSGKSKFFVLIDEPELSLSVPWQKRFLVDVFDGGFCAGLVAVTHSPFIYDNKLRGFAHSMSEFITTAEF